MGSASAAAEGWEVLRSRIVDDLRVPTSGLHPVCWPAVPAPPARGDIQGVPISGILDPLSASERKNGGGSEKWRQKKSDSPLALLQLL